jgi:hypothetical protein
MIQTKMPKGFWTKDICSSYSAKYNTRYEWQSRHLASYKAAYKNGWLDDCCTHMEELLKPKGFWTLEKCAESASKFQSRNEWRLGDHPAYQAARKSGWVNACCAHMLELAKPDGYWDFDKCLNEASNFKTRSEWARWHASSYSSAQRNGWLGLCSQDMTEVIKKWTKEECLSEAAKYASRTDWKLGSPSSHGKAMRSGWFEGIADAVGMPNYSGSSAQRAFAERFRNIIRSHGIELREEVYAISGPRTKTDMVFYRDGVPFLAVEYQGAWWHSEAAGKSRDYHRNRMVALRVQSIRLITVHEADADNPVIENMISGALGLIDERIRASKCSVTTVSDGTSSAFYEYSHIQGGRISGKGRLNLGLKFDGKLVACMTFVRANNRHTGSGKYDWCLHRFATLPGIRVMGAAGRLFKHFRKEHPAESVISYCDLQFFDGRTYSAIGFEHIRDNAPDYRWVKAQTVLAKHETQRKFLPDLLGDAFDESLSERENMERAGFSKIWDCGKAVYAYVP